MHDDTAAVPNTASADAAVKLQPTPSKPSAAATLQPSSGKGQAEMLQSGSGSGEQDSEPSGVESMGSEDHDSDDEVVIVQSPVSAPPIPLQMGMAGQKAVITISD